MSENNDWTSGCVSLVIVVLVILGAVFEKTSNQISVSAALTRFYEITKAEDIEVVRHSNNDLVFGDTHDVTFELLVDGQPESGRCTSAVFSPMICRIYSGED